MFKTADTYNKQVNIEFYAMSLSAYINKRSKKQGVG